VRSDSRGYQILASLRGPIGSFRTVSMSDVLTGKVSGDFVRSRLRTAQSRSQPPIFALLNAEQLTHAEYDKLINQ